MKRTIYRNPPLCACGCGQFVKKAGDLNHPHWNQYLNGHCLRGKNVSDAQKKAVREHNIKFWTGRKHSDSAKKKMSLAKLGRRLPENHRKHIAQSLQGHEGYWTNRHHSYSYKLKMSLRLRGSNGPGWKGGISSLPYAKEWTRYLKYQIKERDNFQCQNPCCKKKGGKIHIHHVDYDKLNCTPSNLICLCSHCHSRTQHNRDCWQRYLTHRIIQLERNC